MLSETKTVDRIEILPDGTVQLRHRIAITDTETGQLRASHHERQVVVPGSDLTGLCPRTSRIIVAAWTPEPAPAPEPEPIPAVEPSTGE
jgi:hypothetical protein